MRKETDEVIKYMLDNDMDSITEASCRAATCFKGNRFEDRKGRLHALVAHGFFKRTVNNYRGFASYIPMVKTKKTKNVLYPTAAVDEALGFPETLHHDRLRIFLNKNPARKHNVATREKSYRDALTEFEGGGAGRLKAGLSTKCEQIKREVHKLQSRETLYARLLAHLSDKEAAGDRDAAGCVSTTTTYRTKYDRRGRRNTQGTGVQGLQKSLQCLLVPDAEELDIQSAQFSLLTAIVDRVGVELQHPAAEFTQLRRYCEERDAILLSLQRNWP